MPNSKSAIKRVKINSAKAVSNIVKKSALKTSIKKCKEEITDKSDKASDILKNTFKAIDKAASRNLIHKNTAARRKSKLAKALNNTSK